MDRILLQESSKYMFHSHDIQEGNIDAHKESSCINPKVI